MSLELNRVWMRDFLGRREFLGAFLCMSIVMLSGVLGQVKQQQIDDRKLLIEIIVGYFD